MTTKPIHVMSVGVVAWATLLQDELRKAEGRHVRWVRALSDDGLTEVRVTADRIDWRAHGKHKTKWRPLDVDALLDGVGVPLEGSEREEGR